MLEIYQKKYINYMNLKKNKIKIYGATGVKVLWRIIG